MVSLPNAEGIISAHIPLAMNQADCMLGMAKVSIPPPPRAAVLTLVGISGSAIKMISMLTLGYFSIKVFAARALISS